MADLSDPADQAALDGFLKSQGAGATPAPQSGAAHDTVWGSLLTTGGKILDAFGQGAADKWGTDPEGFQGFESALDKIDSAEAKGYAGKQVSILKGYNEAFARPVASALDTNISNMESMFGIPGRALSAAGGGLQGASEETAKYPFIDPSISSALGIAGEVTQGAAETGFPELMALGVPHAPPVSMTDIAAARSVGAIGEGEAGYFETQPLTPRNAEARASAAQEAGIEPPTPEPAGAGVGAEAAPTRPALPDLARQVDPETFSTYDTLSAERQAHTDRLGELEAEREASPEVTSLRQEIKSIVGVEEGEPGTEWNKAFWDSASDTDRARLMDAELRLDDLLHTESPEMTAAREGAEEATRKMGALLPQVSSAYRHAESLLEAGEEASPAKAATPEAPAAEEAEPPSAIQPDHPGAVVGAANGAEGGPVAEGQAPTENVVGAQTLGGSTEPEAAPSNGEPTGENVFGGQKLGDVGSEQPAASARKPVTDRYGNLKPVEGTGESKPLGLSKSAEESAIRSGLTEKFGDLPEYNVAKNEAQLSSVVDMMDRDWDRAKAIAMGDRAPPPGALANAFYVGVLNRAEALGDVDTALKLGLRSKLLSASKTMGQNIQILSRLSEDSPTTMVRDVQSAREGAFNGDLEKAKAQEVANITAEERRAIPRPEEVVDWLKGEECG